MIRKRPALLMGNPDNIPYVFPEEVLFRIGNRVEWTLPPERTAQFTREEWGQTRLPPHTEVIFSTWGMPRLERAFLDALPNLQAVFYAAGSVRCFVTDESWRRGVRIFSAAQANAVPVAEFTVAQIVLGLKKAHQLRDLVRQDWAAAAPFRRHLRGNYRSRVGLVSYGAIARLVRKLLRGFEHEVWVYDPFLSAEAAELEEVRLVGLDELFRSCHAVSLHTPWLKETENLIRGHHFASMLPDAVFINTARGAIVHQAEMTAVLQQRPDLTAVLDVTYPEPPAPDDPLLRLPNVWLTPHIAGSLGHECGRMGHYMLEAYQRFLANEPSRLEVHEAQMATMA